MKKIMTFLVAGLIIVSAIAISSCKKTNTNANADDAIPTTFDFVDLRDETPDFVTCYYCGDTIWKCYDNPPYIDYCFYCPEHSHIDWFEVGDNCYDPNQSGECEYKFKCRHRHVITYMKQLHAHSWHVGGSGNGGH